MYETQEEYLKIVREQVHLQEIICRCSIHDGDMGYCPRCGEYGTWDIATRGFVAAYDNSIYYSTVFYEWRCRLCDFHMCR